jgi:hypothetical protein
VSRLEAAGKHSPSVATLTKYAKAVGCEVEIKLVPTAGKKRHFEQKDGQIVLVVEDEEAPGRTEAAQGATQAPS